MKKILTLALIALAAITSHAQEAEDTVHVYLEPFTIKAGEVKDVTIYLDNTIALKDFQLQWFFPKDLQPVAVYDEDSEAEILITPLGYGLKKNVGYTSAIKLWNDTTWRLRMVSVTLQTGGSTANKFKPGKHQAIGLIHVKATKDFTTPYLVETKATPREFNTDNNQPYPLMFTWLEEDNTVRSVLSTNSTVKAYAAKPLAWFSSDEAVAGEFGIDDAVAVTAQFGDNEYYVSNANNEYLKLVAPATTTGASGISPKEESTLPNNIAAQTIMGEFAIDANGNPTLQLAATPEAAETEVTTTTRNFKLAEHFAPEANEVVKFEGFYRASDNRICAYSNFGGDQGQCITAVFNDGITAPQDQDPVSVIAAMQLKNPWASAAEGLNDKGVTSAASAGAWKNYTAKVVDLSTSFTTAVNDILSKDVAGVKYVNVAGMESDAPFEGVNIVVTTYTDGTTATSKILK